MVGQAFFKLEAVDAKGISVRRHLEMVERIGGFTPKELLEAEVPLHLTWLLGLFIDLSSRRQAKSLVPWTEISAWLTLRKLTLSGPQLGVIFAFDRAFVSTFGGV